MREIVLACGIRSNASVISSASPRCRHAALPAAHVARPGAHARDFAERYAEPLDLARGRADGRIGHPEDQIGMPDDDRGIPWAAFHPLGTEGGYNSPDGRLVVESGLFNFDLLRKDYGEEAARMFADSDVTSRLDAIIAHEYEEYRHGGSHVEALKYAPVHRTADH